MRYNAYYDLELEVIVIAVCMVYYDYGFKNVYPVIGSEYHGVGQQMRLIIQNFFGAVYYSLAVITPILLSSS